MQALKNLFVREEGQDLVEYALLAALLSVVSITILTTLGCIPWIFMLTFLGKQVGDNWESWKDYLHYVDYAVAAAIVLFAIFLFVRWRRNRNDPLKASGEPAADAPR